MTKETEEAFLKKLAAWTEARQEELVADVISLVNIRSVKEAPAPNQPFGPGPAAVIDQGLELGKRYGFETENDDYFSLSFILKGNTEKELAIISHVDVVPEGNGWTYEPYQAQVVDGYIVGRGSGDDKGPSVAALYALRALKELDTKLKHSVRIIWGANEESGMEDVKHYLQTHTQLPDFTIVADGGFSVNIGEKGGLSGDLVFDIGTDSGILNFNGGVARNAVPDYAFIVLKAELAGVKTALAGKDVQVSGQNGEVKVEARGIASHAARPEGSINAIQKLARIITDSKLLSGKAYEAVEFIAEAFSDYYGEGLDIAAEDDISGKTTHIGGLISFEDGKLIQNFNSRVAIRTDPATLVPRLEALGKKRGFIAANIRLGPSRYDSPDSPPVKILMETGKLFLGDKLKPPATTGGGTHAKYFPRSIPFGAKSPPDEAEKEKFGSAHAADEAIAIDDLVKAVQIYAVDLIRLDELYG
ncbi:MAG: Sapep family Mn(2+)-dependent dipeptidase [Treponema sp.]|jgi:succinyl-diaminopimelate desuccinylase|nr:Sapep family Mn(2+)-dependent dipeptidase [Treponema sp.]